MTSDVDHKLAEMSLRSWLSPHLTIPQNLLEHALVSTLQRMQEKLDKGEDGKSFQGYFSRALLGSITKAVNLARDAEAEPSTRFSQKNGKVNHNAVLDRLFEGLSSS